MEQALVLGDLLIKVKGAYTHLKATGSFEPRDLFWFLHINRVHLQQNTVVLQKNDAKNLILCTDAQILSSSLK